MMIVLYLAALPVVIVALIVGYLLHTEVPAAWPQPWLTRIIVLVPLKFIKLLVLITFVKHT